jgi:hypothetical protein
MLRSIFISSALALPFAACSPGSSMHDGIGSNDNTGAAGNGTGGDTYVVSGSGGDNSVIASQGSSGGAAGAGGAVVSGPSDQPVSIDACTTNTAGLSDSDVKALQAGSGNAGALRLLNPYDGTVFPRGLIAPLLMWDGADADAVYVHIKASTFEYKGCLKPTAPGQLQLPQDVWDSASGHTQGASDPFSVELTVEKGGTVTGPAVEKIVIAQATLKGTIYYNSYASKLVSNGFAGNSGAVLRIVPGKNAEVFLGQSACIGCHTVSANGTRLSAVLNPQSPLSTGATYALTQGMAVNPPPLAPTAANTAFTALSPDGSVYLSSAHAGGLGTRTGAAGIISSIFAPNATLYETDTGNTISNTGIATGAMTPSFSPDGTLLVFNDYAIDNGHGIATMSFDGKARTASSYKKLLSVSDPTTYPAWPLFLPDNKAVVFAVGTTTDFSGANLGIAGNTGTVSSDVHIADVTTGTVTLLNHAMGFASDQDAASGTTYLPFGAEELHHNFYPTGSPVAAGGYFWVFFDSYRHYGNTHAGAQVRQLWGTAIDISPTGSYTSDPSHPPFYLTGQEDVEGNHRAFTALDACHKDGDTCATGIDCCGGFCTNGTCGKPPDMGPLCAHTDESCAGGTPCCDTRNQCINGFCGSLIQ